MPKDKKKNGLAKELSPKGSSFGGRLIGRVGRMFKNAPGEVTRKIGDKKRPNDKYSRGKK